MAPCQNTGGKGSTVCAGYAPYIYIYMFWAKFLEVMRQGMRRVYMKKVCVRRWGLRWLLRVFAQWCAPQRGVQWAGARNFGIFARYSLAHNGFEMSLPQCFGYALGMRRAHLRLQPISEITSTQTEFLFPPNWRRDSYLLQGKGLLPPNGALEHL